jgi:hypothetical protein
MKIVLFLQRTKLMVVCGLLAGVLVVAWLGCGETMQKKSAAPTEVLIKFKPGVPEDSVRAFAAQLGLEQVRELKEIGVRVFRTTSRVSVEQVLRSCQSSSHIEYAEPNSTVKIPEKP